MVAGTAGTLVYLLNDPSRPLPKTASYVPKDSAFVLTTHVGDLLEKGNVSDLLSKGVLEEMGMPRQIRKKIEDLFDDPAQFGMDTKEPVYFSMQPGPDNSEYPVYCITVPVTNSKDFLDGMEDLVTVEGRPDKMLMAVIDDLRKAALSHLKMKLVLGLMTMCLSS